MTAELAQCFYDQRNPVWVDHSVRELVRQRIFATALGYEDINDHQRLRLDPLLAAACGKTDPLGEQRVLPQHRGIALAAPSTLNRLELSNNKDTRCHKLPHDPAKIEAMITENTRLVCVPNLIGNVADWESIGQIARKHGLSIIEDSADTLGATLNGHSTGRVSSISVTSFYGSHVINCAGNGGILCVRDEDHARKARLLRSWGRSSSLFVESEAIENRFDVSIDGIDYDAKFLFEAVGYNLEPSELGAAFGLVQLANLQNNIEARIANFEAQYDFFKRYEDWFVLPRQAPRSRTGWLAWTTLPPTSSARSPSATRSRWRDRC